MGGAPAGAASVRSVEQTTGNASALSASTPQEVIQQYFAALNNSDVDGIVSLFTEDGEVLANGYPSARGKTAIHAMFQEAFAATKMQRDVHMDRVLETGALAVVRAHSTGTLTLLNAGQTIGQENRELYPLQRSADGWRIAEYMFNSSSAGQS